MIVRIVGWLINLGEFLLAVNLVRLLVALFAKPFRKFTSGLLFLSASVWTLTLILWSAVTVYAGWGWFLTAIGLLVGFVGIIPVAFFCLLFGRHWLDLGELLFQVALALGGYAIASRIMAKE